MTRAQFVTVPILDARLQEVRTEIRVLEEKFVGSIRELNSKLDALDGTVDVKLSAMEARIDAKLATMEAKLVRWVFLIMLGNVALSLAANTLLNALKALT